MKKSKKKPTFLSDISTSRDLEVCKNASGIEMEILFILEKIEMESPADRDARNIFVLGIHFIGRIVAFHVKLE